MARLKLSAAGLTSPLDVGPAEPGAPAEPAPVIALVRPVAEPAPGATDEPAAGAPPTEEPDAGASATDAPVADAADPPAAPRTDPTADGTAPDARPEVDVPGASFDHDVPEATAAVDGSTPAAAPAGVDDGSPRPSVDLPEWAAALPADRLAPDALLGRPRQTALILDVAVSRRLDALAAEAGPRATVAALISAVLHFHLPEDGDAAARAIGAYRRARLDDLDRDWEERNARLPGAVRDRVDELVAVAGRRVADVRRSTLVNALLDAHLPHDPREAARLATRLAMVRGGAFVS